MFIHQRYTIARLLVRLADAIRPGIDINDIRPGMSEKQTALATAAILDAVQNSRLGLV